MDKKAQAFKAYPKAAPPFYAARSIACYNACNESCDMFYGPCCCGAWHYPEEWNEAVREAARKEEDDGSPVHYVNLDVEHVTACGLQHWWRSTNVPSLTECRACLASLGMADG